MFLIRLAGRAGVPNLSRYDRGLSLPNQEVHRIILVRCTTSVLLLILYSFVVLRRHVVTTTKLRPYKQIIRSLKYLSSDVLRNACAYVLNKLLGCYDPPGRVILSFVQYKNPTQPYRSETASVA